MPVVPTYDNATAQPAGLPNAQMADPTRLMQWATLGPMERERLGTQMGGAGREIAQLVAEQQASVNEAAVKDTVAKYTTATTQILHGTDDDPSSGYLTQRGGNAANPDVVSAVHANISDTRDSLADTLTNPRQRELFMQASIPTMQAAASQVATHAGQQTLQYQMDSSTAISQASGETAIKSFNPLPGSDNSMYQLSLARQKTELETQAQIKGLSGDASDEYVRSGLASTYAGVVNHLTEVGQTTAAKAFLALPEVNKAIDEKTQDKLRSVLDAADTKDDSLKVALEVAGRVKGPIGAQQADLDQQYKDGKITADVHDMALQRLRANNAQRRSEQAENDKSVIGAVWDAKNKNPNLTLADLPASMIAYVKQRGLGSHVDAMLSSGPATDNPTLYNDLMRQSASADPKARQAFVEADLSKYVGQLSMAHWNHLVGIQQGIDRGNLKLMDANHLVHDTVTAVHADMKAAGFNFNGKPGDDDANKLADFETKLRDTLVSAQAAKQGTPLGRDEARTIALGLMKDQALAGTGMFGLFQAKAKPWQMTDEQRAAPWVVPDNDRKQIAASLQRRGLPATEENIQQTYKISKGLR